MSVLNSWQKLDYVLPGLPFGDGIDGAYSSATIPTLTYRSCGGTVDSTTLTLGSSGFTNGDVLLIHQSRGTSVGSWMVNKIVSGGGTTSLTLLKPLKYTYTDSGASQAQAIKVPRYTTVSVPTSQTWTLTEWDKNINGILVFASSESTSVTGTINATGKGYDGGTGGNCASGTTYGYQGENTGGTGSASQSAAKEGGGGGKGVNGVDAGGGGGGSHATNGATGGTMTGSGYGGSGATTTNGDSTDLTTIIFGGGGGGNNRSNDGPVIDGATGGGIVIIFSKDLTITGAINAVGNTAPGTDASWNGGGSGAGGSVLIACQTGTLGTTKINASGGAQGAAYNGNAYGGAGGSGRIAVHHSSTVTGTTSPTFTDVSDTSLRETAFMGSMI